MPPRLIILLLLFAVILTTQAAESSPRSSPHVVLVGDSTVAANGGWGPAFQLFLTGGATGANAARAGRSSKSFLAEGHWATALALKGDYYLIQFGHNDQPGKGPERETDPSTTFAANLTRYVEEVRANGGIPVLVTPLTRRKFSKTDPRRIGSDLGPYAEAMKRVAAEQKVPCIDLHARSIALCEQLGPEGTAKLNPVRPDGSTDTTHLGASGGMVFARLVAEELGRVVPALAPYLHEPTPVTQSTVRAMTFISDRTYGSVDGEDLRLDAAVPAGGGTFPIVILIHGGGWTGGSKEGDIASLMEPLTVGGFTCFAINYRLAPAHRWPACLDDVLAAVRWVKANAAEFKGDPSRIALLGYSAGGHLACFAATVVDDSAKVQAVVGLAPLTDFIQELPKRGNILGRAQRGLLNRAAELTPESVGLLQALSPVNHLRPGLPPFLLMHGDADGSVPYEQSVTFQSRLQAQGVHCDLVTLPGAPHRLAEWPKFKPDFEQRLLDWLHEALVAQPDRSAGSN